jgi:menaquinone-dependent protoporphyrinogen IX oxidase
MAAKNPPSVAKGHGKILVLYKTKYGSTKQYAEWIADALDADLLPMEHAWKETLERYDTVILGGSVRMGIITCSDFCIRHWEILKDKRIILFSVSGSKPTDPDIQDYYERSLPLHIRQAIHYVPLWGRLGTLDWKDRMLMIFPRVSLRNQLAADPGNPVLREKYEHIMKPFDHVTHSAIGPILDYTHTP